MFPVLHPGSLLLIDDTKRRLRRALRAAAIGCRLCLVGDAGRQRDDVPEPAVSTAAKLADGVADPAEAARVVRKRRVVAVHTERRPAEQRVNIDRIHATSVPAEADHLK